ncbi:MAG: hypothetical protein JO130_15140 [Solirubrobacterales bacterium]|nr:hypothetical protein [Solirubrobacterales bacterium]
MLKSTVGTWVNYATTALFQVLFASRFGAGTEASAYALSFAIAVGIGATFIGTTQAIYLPRLLTAGDDVSLATVGRMARLLAIALLVFAVVGASASLTSPVIAPKLDLPDIHLALLLRVGCGFGFLQVVVAQAAALCWARGARLLPAMSPAIPSLLASAAVVANRQVSPLTLYLLLIVGSVLQLLVLMAVSGRGLVFSPTPRDRRGEPPMLVSLGLFATAQVILPFELAIAAHGSQTGGAYFNYAYRAVTVAQALIVGGIAAASLPDWSAYVRAGARERLQLSLTRSLSAAALALTLAASVALVASTALVRLAFQRGNFTGHDTRVVSTIVVACLVGFVAEGVTLVLGQALAADRRLPIMIIFGQGRVAVLIALVAVLGLTGGPVGVAAGYSVANLIALALQLLYLHRDGLLAQDDPSLVRSTARVMICTGATGLGLKVLGVAWPMSVALVVAMFAAATVSVRHGIRPLRAPH